MLASDTGPVREMITDGQNGLLVDFFDADNMASIANRVLDVPLRDHAELSGLRDNADGKQPSGVGNRSILGQTLAVGKDVAFEAMARDTRFQPREV